MGAVVELTRFVQTYCQQTRTSYTVGDAAQRKLDQYIAVLLVSCACELIVIFLLCSVWLVLWLNGFGLVMN